MPGTTCCVPGCLNNNLKNKDLSFYVFPKQKVLRSKWLRNINRAGNKGRFSVFVPTSTHRVCSAHFEGGRKSYMGNVPTIFPWKSNSASTVTTRKSPTPRNPPAMACTSADNDLSEQESDDPLEIPSVEHVQLDHTYTTTLEEVDSDGDVLVPDFEQPQLCDVVAELEAERRKNLNLRSQLRHKTEECKRLHQKVSSLIVQLEFVKKDIKQELKYKSLKKSPDTFRFYTGTSVDEFNALFEFFRSSLPHIRYFGTQRKLPLNIVNRRKLSGQDEMLLFLTRLRAGLLEEDLAYRFAVSPSTVSRIFRTWLDLFYTRFRNLDIWASKAVVQKYMPKCFQEKYPDLRVVIDCTELFIEKPSDLGVQSMTYSSYKSHNTAKGLVGISPNGLITFVSDLSPGRTSDRVITHTSGLISKLADGDTVMADKGFDIEDLLAAERRHLSLSIPPYAKAGRQFSAAEVSQTIEIANCRIYVEHAMGRIKKYRLLKYVFPNSMATELNKVWVVCCYLCNFCMPPILK